MLRFLEQFKKDPSHAKSGKWILLSVAAIGILLLLLSGNAVSEKDTASATETGSDTDELLQYQAYVEERVKTLCRSVEGITDVTAIVTLENGFQAEYATEYKDGTESYVILGNGSSAQALLLSHDTPNIAGIGIVCHGAEEITARCELINLISAAFHVPSNRIYVISAN